MKCETCGEWVRQSGKGRVRRFCTSNCRLIAHRNFGLPSILTKLDRWTRADGKRPIRPDGSPASSTDPATWSRFTKVKTGAGNGFGLMMGDGLACYDLDDCFDGGELKPYALELLTSLDPIFVERSMSGNGLHVFVHSTESRGYKRDGIEFYPSGRFIRTTGRRYDLPAGRSH